MDNPFGGAIKKSLAMATAIGSLVAWSGGCGTSAGSPSAVKPRPPANIAGWYNAAITASSTCAANLPAATRALTYVANVTQTGAAVQVRLLGPVNWHSVTVNGTVSGRTVNFSSFSFSENDTGGGVAVVATGTASVAGDGSIAGALSGTYGTPLGQSCNAGNHQLQMVRR